MKIKGSGLIHTPPRRATMTRHNDIDKASNIKSIAPRPDGGQYRCHIARRLVDIIAFAQDMTAVSDKVATVLLSCQYCWQVGRQHLLSPQRYLRGRQRGL